MLSCQRCKTSHNGPQAFLLTCLGCSKTWHHRCHQPPVEDDVLIQLVRATNAGDTANDIRSWRCRRCKKSASVTSSVAPSREQTYADRGSSLSGSLGPAPEIHESITHATVTSYTGVREGHKPAENASAKSTRIAKRPRSPAGYEPRVFLPPGPAQCRDTNANMAGITPTKLGGESSHIYSMAPWTSRDTAMRQSVDTVSTAPSEDHDVEMEVESLPPISIGSTSISRATSQAPQTPSDSAVDMRALVGTVASTKEPEEMIPVDRTVVQTQAADEMDDDPDDLYGPPVERRVIRVLPSLIEELKEQRRQAAAAQESQRLGHRAPLAPDWILARHVNDPLWKEMPARSKKQRGRKAFSRKLGDNGLNVGQLMACWVRPQ